MAGILKEWIITLSTIVSVISVAVGILLSLREYRLKLRAETRVANSNEIENEVKLLRLFTELMNTAHARGGYQVSEKTVELLLQREVLKQMFGDKPVEIKQVLENAIFTIPVGEAQQDAAIAAVAVLGKRHEMLREVSVQALESLAKFKKEIAGKYLNEMKG